MKPRDALVVERIDGILSSVGTRTRAQQMGLAWQSTTAVSLGFVVAMWAATRRAKGGTWR
jgi:hypothetical protein